MDLACTTRLAGTAAIAVALGCASTVDQGRIPRDAGSDLSPVAPDATNDTPDVPDANFRREPPGFFDPFPAQQEEVRVSQGERLPHGWKARVGRKRSRTRGGGRILMD